MPRGTKESDEEVEVKTAGRRSRIANTTADSPLRRSTRNRQQKSEDVSPDSSNNAAGPRTRTTRRTTAATTSQETEGTRSLRSRRTSTTSETSENHDTDDTAKRPPVKKSIAVVGTAPDTPTKVRRSMRAGSESKIIQSPARSSRRTRASSADVEERDIEIKHHDLQKIHQNTPTKTRRRVSALPLQPSVVEETEKEKIQNVLFNESKQIDVEEVDDNTQNETELNKESQIMSTNVDTPNKSMNLTQSPSLRLNFSCTEPDTSYTAITDNPPTKESIEASTIPTDTIKASSGVYLKSIIEDVNDTHMEEDTQIFNTNNIISTEAAMNKSPKVIVERLKSPISRNISVGLENSPGNKENEKANVFVNKIENKHSDSPTQRKSLLPAASENISINKKLNKSIDDRFPSSNTDAVKISSLMTKKTSESLIDTVDENVANNSTSLPNESVIFVAEVPKPLEQTIKSVDTRTVDSPAPNQMAKEESIDTSTDFVNENTQDDNLKKVNETLKGLVVDNLETSVMIINEIHTCNVLKKASENVENDEPDKLANDPDGSGMLVDEDDASNVLKRKSIPSVYEEIDEDALLASPQTIQMDVDEEVDEASTLMSPNKAVDEASVLKTPEKTNHESPIVKSPEMDVVEASTSKSPDKPVEGASIAKSPEKAIGEPSIVESPEKAVDEATMVKSPEKAAEASILESPEKAVEEATILKLIEKVTDETSFIESPAEVAGNASFLNSPEKSVQEQSNKTETMESEIKSTDKNDASMPSIPAVETVNTLKNDEEVTVTEEQKEKSTENQTKRLEESEEVSKDGKLLLEECQSAVKKVTNEIVDDDSKSIDDSDTDIVNCFKDIPADEWNGEETSQSNENVITANTEKDESNIATEKCVEKNVEKAGDINVEVASNNSDAFEITASVENPMNGGEPMDTAEEELELDVDKMEDSPTKRLTYYESMFNRSSKESPKTLDKQDNVNLNSSNAQTCKSPIKRITPIKVNILEDKRMNMIDPNFPRKSLDSVLNIQKSIAQDLSSMSRKSLGGSILLNKNEDRNELDNLMKKKPLEKPRKSLNNSKQIDDKAMDICEEKDEEDDEEENNEKTVALNSSKSKSRKSLNKSGLTTENIDEEKSKNLSSQATKETRKSMAKSSAKKSKLQNMSLVDKDESGDDDFRLYNRSIARNLDKSKNISTIVQVNSDSDVDDEIDSTEGSPMLPAFLYGGNTSSSNSDSDNESSSIDDDVKREYNLDGTDVSEYSDDNVPGDICRESESSGSEEEEEDDDMADFIVDDDEDVDEEVSDEDQEDEDEEEEEEQRLENIDEADEIDVETIDDDEVDEDNDVEIDVDKEEDSEDLDEEEEAEEEQEDDEEAEEHDVIEEEDELSTDVEKMRYLKKHLEFNSSAEDDLDKSLKKSKTPLTSVESRLVRVNKHRQSWNEQCENSIDSKIDSIDIVEGERSAKKSKTSRASIGTLNKSITGKESSASASKQSAKKNKSLSKSMLENSFIVEDTVERVKASQPINDRSRLSRGSLSNKSMVVSNTTSPETISLLKEKLNDTLPALKLDARGKGKRRSTLFLVENAIAENDQQSEEGNDDNSVEEAISKNTVGESSGEKKKKKKKNKKIKITNGFAVENTSHELSQDTSQVSLNLEEKNSEKEVKRKKKKQTQKESLLSEEVSDGASQKKKKMMMKKKAVEMLEVEEEESQKKKKKVQINHMNEENTEISEKKTKKQNLLRNKTPFNPAKNKMKRQRSSDLDDTTFTSDEFDISINSVSVESKKKRKSKEDRSLQTKAGESSASVQVPLIKSNNVKRLPEDVLESLSDIKLPPRKKRKVDPRALPSKSMFGDDINPISDNFSIEDDGFIPLSYSGGTTQFYVENLEKPKKSKKLAAVYSFRERMLRRNSRQPVSAYLMYQQKRKASNKDKY